MACCCFILWHGLSLWHCLITWHCLKWHAAASLVWAPYVARSGHRPLCFCSAAPVGGYSHVTLPYVALLNNMALSHYGSLTCHLPGWRVHGRLKRESRAIGQKYMTAGSGARGLQSWDDVL
eukprot:1161819-Pelagomonas_calceolata.AAC.3